MSHNQPYKISTYLLPHLINNPPMLVHKLAYLLSHIYASVELLYLSNVLHHQFQATSNTRNLKQMANPLH